MRYHKSELNEPWPLNERLWEARRGLWVGLATTSVILGFVLVVAEFFGHLLDSSVPLGAPALLFLFHWYKMILPIFLGMIWSVWMQDLDTVNRDSITFEEIVLQRLDRIEARINPAETTAAYQSSIDTP